MRNPAIPVAIITLVLATGGFAIKDKINNSKNTNQILGESQEQAIQPSKTPTPTQIPTPTPNEGDIKLQENARKTIQEKQEADKKKTEIEGQTNQTPVPPASSYTYDSFYPIILSLSDNKGGSTKHSEYNQYSQGSSITGITLKVGDTVRWKAEAGDPKDRQILYSFHSNSQRFTDLFGRENGQYKYTPSHEIEFTITEADINEVGESLTVVLNIRSEKENYRTGSNGYDDVASLDYKLSR